ncbi:MAG: acyl-CoA dehydrogenase family protein [Flavobacteriaceae bacterium]
MDFTFTADQDAIRDLARSVFSDFCDDERIRKLSESATVFDRDLWAQLGATGLIGLSGAEEVGGSGQGMLELSAVLETQGRYLAPVPLWTSQLVGLAIGAFGMSPALKEIAGAIHAGHSSATIWTEAPFCAPVQARREGNGWRLDGFVSALIWGRSVDWALLPVETEGGRRFALLKLDDPDILAVGGELTNQMPVADLALGGVRLTEDYILSDAMTTDWLQTRSALSIASLQLGVVEEALRRAAGYLGEREQFGRPIGSFQGVAMRMADSYIEVELLRSIQLRLAWLLDNGLDATDAARVAKFHASEAGYIVGHTAIHYHGGVGADLTHPIHRFYLWSRALEMTGGASEAQLNAIGNELPAIIGEDLS